MEVINTSGRCKKAIARVYLSEGKGDIVINKRDYKDYFTTGVMQFKVQQPFAITETTGKYDVKINVTGGGTTGQVEAARLAISKALIEINPEWKPALKLEGLTTRDPRMVERKKFG